jgi:hypothetical protein
LGGGEVEGKAICRGGCGGLCGGKGGMVK